MGESRTPGQALRHWRRKCGLSQLELSSRSGVSTRHISYVETGRANPSRETILRLASYLDIPLRERNRILLAAGHAPSYPERPLDSPELVPALVAVRRIVAAHQPYPALAMDGRWNLLWANPAARILMQGARDDLLREPVNMMRLGLHPAGVAPRVRNFSEVRRAMLARLARQVERTDDPVLRALLGELAHYGAGEDVAGFAATMEHEIALPLNIEYAGHELSLLNTVTTFGSAYDLTLHDVVIETYLPVNAETAAALGELSIRAGAPPADL
ncbi:helix-turn-helix transcriptional regulator [Nonomuraea sp. B1E8]